ncbi:MAG: hypothetical protein RLZ98_2809 [Pseudomonadota bacterium]|jgi:hypothetical protein
MIFWTLGIGISVAALVLAAAARGIDPNMAYAHLAIAAATNIFFALLAIRENQALARSGAPYPRIASNSARFMGFVWAWAALNLALTYGTGVLVWKEWLVFTLATVVVAGICLLISAMMRKDAETGRTDEAMIKLGRGLALVQLVGMIIAIVGLIVDGKMTRFLDPRHTDWAANNIFFFGALAIAAVSAYEMRARRGGRSNEAAA